MKNPPAFQFYPQDFLSDLNVQSMTDEEVGKYVKLLCHCWIEDGLPVGSRVVEGWFNQHPAIAICFTVKDDHYRNKRLDEERQKQLKWSEKSRKGGVHSAENKKAFKGGSTKGQPKANQRPTLQSSSSSSLREKNKSFLSLSELLRDRVKENFPFQKISASALDSWANDFRIMVESDHVPAERLRAVLDWATKDSFWKLNIRSASKFREQFGMLEAKSRTSEKPRPVNKEIRVGTRPAVAFEDTLTADARAALKEIDAEYDKRVDTDPKFIMDRNEYRTMRINQIHGGGKS